ncbi:MAG TPA: hypothetical protein VI282_16275 [Verrucomicrobiae bacterium]
MILRVWNTALFWTWILNALRLASSILVLPLLLRALSEADLSMYWQFVFLAGFGYSLDAMFSTTILRHVSYAMRGVSDIQSLGLAENTAVAEKPNYVLLGQLFSATKLLYRLICLVILALQGIGGTLLIHHLATQTSNPTITWTAWTITVVGSCLELYTGYWLVFLRGMNQIVLSTRLVSLMYAAKLVISIILLLCHLGLLAVPIATLVIGIAQRLIARRFIKHAIPEEFRKDSSRNRDLVARIWPTSWRMGIVGLSFNLMMVAFGAIITASFGKDGAALAYRYQFSQQIMMNICIGMSAVWTTVKWPLVMQLRVANDLPTLRSTLWPRVWLQNATLLALCALAISIGPPILHIIAPAKHILPRFWLTLLAVQALFDMQYTFWTTLLTSENRIPSTWAAMITNVSSIVVAYALVKTTDLGLGAFVVAPLVCGLAFNYWYWAKVGARAIGTNWFGYMFHKPRPQSTTAS